jgi:hypothetical protein
MPRQIALVACCGQKLEQPAPAEYLYISPLFKKAAAYARTFKKAAAYARTFE